MKGMPNGTPNLNPPAKNDLHRVNDIRHDLRSQRPRIATEKGPRGQHRRIVIANDLNDHTADIPRNIGIVRKADDVGMTATGNGTDDHEAEMTPANRITGVNTQHPNGLPAGTSPRNAGNEHLNRNGDARVERTVKKAVNEKGEKTISMMTNQGMISGGDTSTSTEKLIGSGVNAEFRTGDID